MLRIPALLTINGLLIRPARTRFAALALTALLACTEAPTEPVAQDVDIRSVAIMMSPPLTPVATAPAQSKVTICHLEGHDGDFVTAQWKTAGTPACSDVGGQARIVPAGACDNSHGAIATQGLTCYQGDLQTR